MRGNFAMTTVTYFGDGAVGVIEMNGPPANSYGISFMRGLDAAIDAAEGDDACRVVVVRSALSGFFCGGADIKQFQNNAPAQNIEMITLAHETLGRPSRSPKIYVAEINGHALGGGLEIALACDLRFAAVGDYWLGLPEVTLGLLPGNGGTQRLAALVGASKAMELMILGTRFRAEEALRLGVVNRLFASLDLRKETMAFVDALAKSATLAVAMIKRSVHDGANASLAAGLAVERRNIATLFHSDDAKEGFSAFIERRKPKFSGR
jgi:enoyl-CoA hydratase/carnithine racemase